MTEKYIHTLAFPEEYNIQRVSKEWLEKLLSLHTK